MEQLLEKFPPGVLPHFFVVQTLGNLAGANGKRGGQRIVDDGHGLGYSRWGHDVIL